MIKEDAAAEPLANRGINPTFTNSCKREDFSLLLPLPIPSFIVIPLMRLILAFLYLSSRYLITLTNI